MAPVDRAADLGEGERARTSGDPEAAQLAEAIAGELRASSARSPSALAELRQWRDRLDAILRVVTDGVIVLNFTGAVVYANRSATALLGTGAGWLIGRDGAAVMQESHVADGDGRRPEPATIPGIGYFYGGTTSSAILRIRPPGQDEIWVRARSAPILDERGGILAVIVVLRDISDARRAEGLARSLRERDELLRIAQEVSPVAMMYFRVLRDSDGRAVDFEWTFQNQAGARINGFDAGAACAGRRMLQEFPALRASTLFARYCEVADSGVPWTGEDHYRDQRFDNWYRLVVVRPTPDALSISVEDVTEQHRLADRLQRLNDLTASLSAARTIDDVAAVAVRTAADAIGADTAVLTRFHPPDELAIVGAQGITPTTRWRMAKFPLGALTPIARAASSRAPLYIESPDEFARQFPSFVGWDDGATAAVASLPLLVHGDLVGALGFRFARAHRFDDSDRQFLEGLAAQVALALDRAALFDEATRTRAEMERQKRRLDVMLQEMPIGVVVIERGGRLVLQNRAAAQIWRIESLDRSPGRYGQHRAFHADGRELRPDEWPSIQILMHGHYEPEEVRILRQDGTTGWMALNAAPIVGDDGQVEAAVVVMSDVTRLKEAEAAASAAGVAAEEANRAKDEFLAMLGHELRNPLAPITTALQLMRLRGGPSIDKERSIIERQVQHLTRLVDDLLDISRITRGKVELRREPVRVVDLLARAVEATSPLFEKKRQIVDLDVGDPALVVVGDVVRLGQVLGNLLTNAAKYGHDGGRVRVSVARDQGSVVVRIVDDGVGIAPDLLPRVFDLFVQGSQTIARSEGGLGLGLAIVRSLVVAHGGTVEARSDGVGRGSEFVVRLPLHEGASVAEASAAASTGAIASMRVLVVDDNRDGAELVGELLAQLGCDVRVAFDGPSALEIVARGFVPDVGLLDIGLPVMDGYELASRLRATAPKVRLIAVTGYGQRADQQRSAEAGFERHLVKPVPPDALATVLRDRS